MVITNSQVHLLRWTVVDPLQCPCTGGKLERTLRADLLPDLFPVGPMQKWLQIILEFRARHPSGTVVLGWPGGRDFAITSDDPLQSQMVQMQMYESAQSWFPPRVLVKVSPQNWLQAFCNSRKILSGCRTHGWPSDRNLPLLLAKMGW
jgi:hypothetical protein